MAQRLPVGVVVRKSANSVVVFFGSPGFRITRDDEGRAVDSPLEFKRRYSGREEREEEGLTLPDLTEKKIMGGKRSQNGNKLSSCVGVIAMGREK
ncbi:hypothetical protein TNCV_4125331 [Trichonephila clavipes]|nr:hypothetical protein TNCV_4125331 [Trichonephila clavipes]